MSEIGQGPGHAVIARQLLEPQSKDATHGKREKHVAIYFAQASAPCHLAFLCSFDGLPLRNMSLTSRRSGCLDSDNHYEDKFAGKRARLEEDKIVCRPVETSLPNALHVRWSSSGG